MNSKSLILIIFYSFTYSQNINHIQRFAESLYISGDFERAITEFKRVNYFYPQNDNFLTNKIKIADSYYLIGKKIESIREYKDILKINGNNWTAVLEIAKIYQNMSFLFESNKHINSYLNKFLPAKMDTLLLLKCINHFKLKNIDSVNTILSGNEFLGISQEKIKNSKIIIKNFQNKNFYDPHLAGILNIVPGLGYYYCGLKQTAFATMIVESIFAYATYRSHRNKNSSGVLIGSLIFSGFVFGSINGSINTAEKQNIRLFDEYSNKLKVELFSDMR